MALLGSSSNRMEDDSSFCIKFHDIITNHTIVSSRTNLRLTTKDNATHTIDVVGCPSVQLYALNPSFTKAILDCIKKGRTPYRAPPNPGHVYVLLGDEAGRPAFVVDGIEYRWLLVEILFSRTFRFSKLRPESYNDFTHFHPFEEHRIEVLKLFSETGTKMDVETWKEVLPLIHFNKPKAKVGLDAIVDHLISHIDPVDDGTDGRTSQNCIIFAFSLTAVITGASPRLTLLSPARVKAGPDPRHSIHLHPHGVFVNLRNGLNFLATYDPSIVKMRCWRYTCTSTRAKTHHALVIEGTFFVRVTKSSDLSADYLIKHRYACIDLWSQSSVGLVAKEVTHKLPRVVFLSSEEDVKKHLKASTCFEANNQDLDGAKLKANSLPDLSVDHLKTLPRLIAWLLDWEHTHVHHKFKDMDSQQLIDLLVGYFKGKVDDLGLAKWAIWEDQIQTQTETSVVYELAKTGSFEELEKRVEGTPKENRFYLLSCHRKDRRWCVLHQLAYWRSMAPRAIEVARRLKDYLDPNILTNDEGQSALHIAIRRDNTEFALFLRKEFGTCPDIRDIYGKTADQSQGNPL